MKAIIWKEWKNSRRLFLVFLVAAILIPALPGQFFPNKGETARQFIRLIWILFSLSAGWLFGEQNRRGTLPFLLARPATKPYLFCAHYLSYLIMLAALIALSLVAHYIQMAIRFPGFSPLGIVFEPGLIFGLAVCFFLFSLSLFIANSFVTFGSTVVGIAFLVFLFLMVIVPFGISWLGTISQSSHSLNIIRIPVIGTVAFSPSIHTLTLTESPLLFLFAMLCGGVVFATLGLLEISFAELRDAKNRRWITAIAVTSMLSVALLIGTTAGTADTVKSPTSLKFNRIITGVKLSGARPAVVGVTNDAVYAAILPPQSATSWRPLAENVVKTEERPYNLVWQKNGAMLAYRSDKPIWGQEIRLLDPFSSYIRRISHSDYSQTCVLGEPFVSPDNDRVAYLKTSTPRLWGKPSTSLWITKFAVASDYAELPGDPATTQWEPIGWTPDGYKFMLRKKEGGKTEIWAVDWVARGPTRFLEEFPNAIITEDDLPREGRWFSFVRKDDNGKWNLRLIDYRTGESPYLGTFDTEPLRSWNGLGRKLAYWEGEAGVAVTTFKYLERREGYSTAVISDPGAMEHEFACPDIAPVLQMRWKPGADKLALVLGKNDSKKTAPRLVLLDPETCAIEPLIEGFPVDKQQWGFYDLTAIVYADDGDLIQYNYGSKSSTTLLSLTSLYDEK